MFNKITRDIFLLFVFSLIVRIAYFIFFVEPEYLFIEDQAQYISLGKQFADIGFLGIPTERVPGYPFFISSIFAVLGESVQKVILVQIILDSISCVLIALMANLLFKKGYWVAGILSAINLNMVILSSLILTDTLFLFFFNLFLFSILKYFQNHNIKWFFLIVLFISLSTLIRPVTYYLLPILLVSLVGWRLVNQDSIINVGKLIVIYIITVLIAFSSIHQRNFQEYGSISIVSQTGTHFLGWVIPATYQYSGLGSYQEGQKLAKKRLVEALERDQLDELPLNLFERSSYQSSVSKHLLLEFGLYRVVKAWFVGTSINLIAPSVSYAPALRSMEHPSFYETQGNGVVAKIVNYLKNSSGLKYISILAFGSLFSISFILLALFGFYRMLGSVNFPSLFTLAILITYFMAITGPIIGVKYRLPIEPILSIFATYAIITWNNLFKK
jgi:hypothetical protein